MSTAPALPVRTHPGALRTLQRPWIILAGAWLLLSAISISWSLATPLSAAPDEPAHLVKAASVVRGQFIGEPTPDGSAVSVPGYIAYTHAQTCYAMNAEVSADCIPAVPGDPWKSVSSVTTAGLYNPLYYLLVGWPSLIFHDSTGVFAMRIVSALICCLFLALSVLMISSWRSRALPVVALAAAVTPMVLFLNAVVNPNSLEIAATLAAFLAVLSIVLEPSPRLLAQRTAILAVSAVVAANMRGLSPLWLAVALLVPLLLLTGVQFRSLLRTPSVRVAIVIVAAGVAFALIWLRSANSLEPALEVPESDRPEVPYLGASPLFGFFAMLAKTGGHLFQMIGIFGWLDTTPPIEVYVIWSVLIVSLIGWALVLLRGRALLVQLVLVASLIVLPAIVQAAFITGGGWIWQGRYALPLLVVVLLASGRLLATHFDGMHDRSIRLATGGVLAAWTLGQVLAFASAIHRYTVGASGSWSDMFSHAGWQPVFGTVATLVTFALLSSAAALCAYRFARSEPRAAVA